MPSFLLLVPETEIKVGKNEYDEHSHGSKDEPQQRIVIGNKRISEQLARVVFGNDCLVVKEVRNFAVLL